MTLNTVGLNQKQFKNISQIVYQYSGINLKKGKETLVRARLMKRVRALNLDNIDSYMNYIESDKGTDELSEMIDVMTTNKTSFFREAAHFNFLCEEVLPKIKDSKLRFWSAACSSGEEPFSLAITLRENISNVDPKECLILATDISQKMLQKAWQGVYSRDTISGLSDGLVRKYFNKTTDGHNELFQIKTNVRKLIRFGWLNLMESWPMTGPFNVIFCRNAMIYFDRPTQETLVNRFWELLAPGGYLFVGHSEGLSGVNHKFNYVQPATYRK